MNDTDGSVRRTPDAEPDDEDVAFAEDAPSLGPCCSCAKDGPNVRNVIMLHQKAPLAGRGWGCVPCGLPNDGAVAVQCDACRESDAAPVWACRGYPDSDGRVPVWELEGVHVHDPSGHPQMPKQQA